MKKLILCLALLLCVTGAMCYTLQFSNGFVVRWANNTTVTMAMNLNFPTLSASNSPALVRAVLQHVMLDVWNPALNSQGIPVQFKDGGLTSTSDVGCDLSNNITFTDTKHPLNPGVLAQAVLFPAGAAGLYVCQTGGPVITTTVDGQILDADITFNTNLAFSPYGLYPSGTVTGGIANDIEGTVLHEMGHVLGLFHSGITSAVMVPRTNQAFPNRTLQSDDIAGINAIYGLNTPGGAVSGKVTDTTGAAVLGAHVVLTNATTGLTTVSALSNADGSYSIVGFVPGTYKITVEPLDGPSNLGNDFATIYSGGNTNFATTYVATPVTVAKGTPLTGQNITVGAAKTGNLQAITVGISANGGFSSLGGGGVISAPRGNTITLCANGTGQGDITTSAPASVMSPTSLTAPDTSGICSGVLARTYSIPASAAIGNYDVYAANAAQIGALAVSTNPSVPTGGIVEGAAFGRVAGTAQFAPGSIISIFGVDMAPALVQASSFPVPTQLGGVSVRIGDRLAPLYFVSAGQINAMIPYEVSGTVPVSVMSGVYSIASAGNITIVPSAPRIFVTAGTQGAIQNGSAADKSQIVDPTHQASVGDILVIYAEGLGQTAGPVSVSGIAGGGQITGALTVSIGGINTPRVDYKGVSPGFVGLYQINAQVPVGSTVGGDVQVYVTDAAGNKSNVVTIGVK